MKIQAILTVNENGNYNIVGWSSDLEERKHLHQVKMTSADGLAYYNELQFIQYMIEFEVPKPDFELKKIPEDKIMVVKCLD